MINFIFNKKEYLLSNELWEKYSLMHPIRTMDSLLSTLKICYIDNQPTLDDIKQLIMDEYTLYLNLDDIIEKARTEYNKSGITHYFKLIH